MNSGYIPALAALAGSAIGGLATFATTWLTQHYQDRAQRLSQEISRRERLFGEFIDQASNLLADALVNNLENPTKLVHISATLGKMQLFASLDTIKSARAVIDVIVETYYRPKRDFGSKLELDEVILSVLTSFTSCCRDELRS